MNVVGRVGNLITQGVYSVATPFHPFGGAVDVIVVKQPDGSFRSTPWYVRFGKFQGVLKGAEKVVRIAVNGVEANFHMYLDNSGEAYFVKEVANNTNSSEIPEDSENPEFVSVSGDLPPMNENDHDHDLDLLGNIRRLKHSVSDSGVVHLQEHIDDSMEERAESDGERGFYDFQDGQSSLDDSVDLSEYGSNRFNGLDGENVVESQNLDSEVVLVSVDGHILTAPITSAEQNSEDVQLSTPRFHLGPGEEAEFGDGDYEFGSGDNPWAVDYMSKLNGAAVKRMSDNVSSGKTGDNSRGHQLQVCGGEEIKHASCELDGREIAVEDDDIKEHIHSDDTVEVKNEDGCKSCSESSREVKDLSSSSAGQISKDPRDITINGDKSTSACSSTSLNKDVPLDTLCENGPVKENGDFSDDTGLDKREGDSDSICGLSENSELKEDQQFEIDTSALVVEADTHTVEDVEIGSTPERPPAVDEGSRNAPTESPTSTYDEMSQTHSNTSFEISICADKLQPGMGLAAAAEAFNAHRVSVEEFKSSASSIVKNGNLVVRFKGQYFQWEKASHIALGIAAFGFEIPVKTKDAIPVEHDNSKNGDPGLSSTPSGRRWRLWSIPFRRVKTLEHNNSSLSNEDEYVDTESVLPNSQLESPTSQSRTESPRKQLVRTNVASSEQIASLNLKDGQNVVTFSFSTRVLGQQQVEAHMYLWKWNARIVISDVDGTITKSDVLGQFMPLVGRDWSQSGVAKLFSAIKENGYQLLFLSARAIVQAYLTRSFLLNLTQDGNSLPNGPVVISPDGLFPSLYREVIRRAPHEFKIACLEDIKRLFPSDYNPFYAGFGNRDTDELSYRKMGIPKGKIFIINPRGEVAINRIDVKSYTSLHTLVNDMFPPTSLVEQEDYNSWNFWRVPLPEVEE